MYQNNGVVNLDDAFTDFASLQCDRSDFFFRIGVAAALENICRSLNQLQSGNDFIDRSLLKATRCLHMKIRLCMNLGLLTEEYEKEVLLEMFKQQVQLQKKILSDILQTHD